MSTKYILPDAIEPVQKILRDALRPFILSVLVGSDISILLDPEELDSKIKTRVEPLVAEIIASLTGNAEGATDALIQTLKAEMKRHARVVAAGEERAADEMIDTLIGTAEQLFGGSRKGTATEARDQERAKTMMDRARDAARNAEAGNGASPRPGSLADLLKSLGIEHELRTRNPRRA
jgi:hypothetical protein